MAGRRFVFRLLLGCFPAVFETGLVLIWACFGADPGACAAAAGVHAHAGG